MRTVIITVESPSQSFVESQIQAFLPPECTVLDVLGDVDNLVEAPLPVWGEALQSLRDKMGAAIQTTCFFTHGRKPLNKQVRGHCRAMTFVRLQSCEREFYPAMFTDPPMPCASVLEATYAVKKNAIAAELQRCQRDKDIESFSVCCGHGIGCPPGILIDAHYQNVFRLRRVIDGLHLTLNHEVKTVSYLCMR